MRQLISTVCFEKTAEHVVELLISPTPGDDETAHTEKVRPVENETALRHWHWVEENRKKVDAMSAGTVAYVYMSNTSIDGYNAFNRYYFSQLNKKAVVIDERFNGGGSVADYVIDMLDRPLLCHWATREGAYFCLAQRLNLWAKGDDRKRACRLRR